MHKNKGMLKAELLQYKDNTFQNKREKEETDIHLEISSGNAENVEITKKHENNTDSKQPCIQDQKVPVIGVVYKRATVVVSIFIVSVIVYASKIHRNTPHHVFPGQYQPPVNVSLL